MDSIEVNRRIPFTTAFNFRDVGGYRNRDGRTVRTRRFYRSDSLHRIGDGDRDAFAALGVRTVIDLRRPYEVERDGRVPDFDGLTYRHIHPDHAEWGEKSYQPGADLARYLADRYADLARTGTAGLAEAIGLIAEGANAPVVVHCVAGKDRTGIVCGLTLAVLGVDDAEIAADYALSTEASQRFTAWAAATFPGVAELPAPFLSSPAEAMLLFLAEIREGHGSVDDYLRHAGVTDDQLAALRVHLLR
ncbi:tyrosine-protein phosphatase [Micromonospora sp. WMMD1082]|uniref:tyrosine-protein phosphatase n=1 Tax=Micromonospora sp. WMMD1082 TaxID=3016104 RepID=UPI0024178A84|nr:tyrosine-protein phosphatase [Micromonospora sp. WMMD1082]MDG4792615.1 tyrosine-protein phosphatase [Micromonospora sp. WMMD1082]